MKLILLISLFELINYSFSIELKFSKSKTTLTAKGKYKYYPFEEFKCFNFYNETKFDSNLITQLIFNKIELDSSDFLDCIVEKYQFPLLRKLTLNPVILYGSFLIERLKVYPKLRKIYIKRAKWSVNYEEEHALIKYIKDIFGHNLTRPTTTLCDDFNSLITYRHKNYFRVENILNINAFKYFQDPESIYIKNSLIDLKDFSNLNSIETIYFEDILIQNLSESISNLLKTLPSLHTLYLIFKNTEIFLDASIILAAENLSSFVLDSNGEFYTTVPISFSKMKYFALDIPSNLTMINISSKIRQIRIGSKTDLVPTDYYHLLESLELKQCQIISNKAKPFKIFDLKYLKCSSNTLTNLFLENFIVTITEFHPFKNLHRADFRTSILDPSFSKLDLNVIFPIVEMFQLTNLDDALLDSILNIKNLSTITILNSDLKESIENCNRTKLFLSNAGVSFKDPLTSVFKNLDGTWMYAKYPNEDNDELTVAMFHLYLSTTVLVSLIGIAGNLLSLIVLLQKDMRSFSGNILLAALCIFDIIFLLTSTICLPIYAYKLVSLFMKTFRPPRLAILPKTRIIQFSPEKVGGGGTKISLLNLIDIRKLDMFQHKFIYPIRTIAYTGSVYIAVIITLERFLAVKFPLQYRTWSSKLKARICIVIVLCFAIIINSSRWLESDGAQIISTEKNALQWEEWEIFDKRIYTKPNILQNRNYRIYYHSYFWAIFMYIIPIFTVIFLNVIIWVQVNKSKAKRQVMTGSSRKSTRSTSTGDNISLTYMLLAVSSMFAVCNLLNALILLYFVNFKNKDPTDVHTFATLPIIFNSSINFLIYYIFGTKFRITCKRIVLNIRGH